MITTDDLAYLRLYVEVHVLKYCMSVMAVIVTSDLLGMHVSFSTCDPVTVCAPKINGGH